MASMCKVSRFVKEINLFAIELGQGRYNILLDLYASFVGQKINRTISVLFDVNPREMRPYPVQRRS